MSITTIEPNKPLFTLVVSYRLVYEQITEICLWQKKPILTTDQDAVIEYAVELAARHPRAAYTVSRVQAAKKI
jgi:hypothetical protein